MVTLQADLAEAAMLRQRQEDTLHQRERELTALKGALKEEVECHDREMEVLREQYSQDMDNLRQTMEQVTQVDGAVFSHFRASHHSLKIVTIPAAQKLERDFAQQIWGSSCDAAVGRWTFKRKHWVFISCQQLRSIDW